ncbi:PREDICTED: oncoprotein-induced transcript 3 protein-like [Branchiostoma belcheri]|uniref:Oncoprotein-induced transcript 3 protein-like n=1 Tax=Branchiostoma belcheri TaxID=7741 RepID=A0A6P5AT45_BRABE|nr:PREDICTED: oncoprotein-induced transcript 3 protein-like [Branchiostoma belcheri]
MTRFVILIFAAGILALAGGTPQILEERNADPCYNYQTLSEVWRNVNHGVNDPPECDRGMNGEWYRFVGAAGDRMPTQRPPSTHRCGAHAPFWMNGAHPSVADGVVSRQACGYYSSDPCRATMIIQVKACSGGFYVYQLPSTSCYYVYCGDINECATDNGGCSHQCVNTQGSYNCACPDDGLTLGPDGHYCTVHGAVIDCTNDYMQVELPRETVGNLDAKHLHWEPDRRCGATANGTHIRLRTGLYECGTQVEFTPDDVIFSNRIVTHGNYTAMLDGVITRGGDVDIPVRCVYPRKELVHTSFQPAVRTLSFTERGVGTLTLRLDAFRTQQFLQPYGEADFPLNMALRSDMFLQLQAEGHQQDDELSVLAESCVATPSMNLNDQHQYVLVENGCPKDATFQSFSSPNPAVQRFGFQVFRFVDDQPVVYVHCEVVVCNATDPNSRCAQGCISNARSKRALQMTGRHFISQGPLVYGGNVEKGWGPVTPSLVAVGGLLCCVLFTAVGVAIGKRQRRPRYSAVPSTDQE